MAPVQAQSIEGPAIEGYYTAAIAAGFCVIVWRHGHLGRLQPPIYSLVEDFDFYSGFT